VDSVSREIHLRRAAMSMIEAVVAMMARVVVAAKQTSLGGLRAGTRAVGGMATNHSSLEGCRRTKWLLEATDLSCG
jgi:hypothetical protein